jgi:FkbM family methyltransferase
VAVQPAIPGADGLRAEALVNISRMTLPFALALRYARAVLPLRGWDRVFRLMFPPDRQRSYVAELPFFGGVYRAEVDNYIDWRVLFYRAYDRPDILVMRRILARLDRPIVLDVGANIGHHTVAMSGLAGEVHAFEPYAGVWPIFARKVARYGASNVTLHKFGLGAENAWLPFAPPAGNNSGTGKFADSGRDVLELRRGDDVLAEAGIGRVDLIKIDVEGREAEALLGLTQALERDRPVIVVEVNDTVAAILAVLPPGYRAFANVRRNPVCDVTKLVKVPLAHRRGDVFCVPSEKLDLIA